MDTIDVVCSMQYALDVVCSMSVMDALDMVCHVDTSLLLHFTMLKITLHHRLQLVWFTNTRGYSTSRLVDHEVDTNQSLGYKLGFLATRSLGFTVKTRVTSNVYKVCKLGFLGQDWQGLLSMGSFLYLILTLALGSFMKTWGVDYVLGGPTLRFKEDAIDISQIECYIVVQGYMA